LTTRWTNTSAQPNWTTLTSILRAKTSKTTTQGKRPPTQPT